MTGLASAQIEEWMLYLHARLMLFVISVSIELYHVIHFVFLRCVLLRFGYPDWFPSSGGRAMVEGTECCIINLLYITYLRGYQPENLIQQPTIYYLYTVTKQV